MSDVITEIGRWWAAKLTAHPFACGLAFIVFFVGWAFQHAVGLRYPDYNSRPEWARWVIFIADSMTTEIKNVILRRFPGPPEATVPRSSIPAKEGEPVR